MTKLIIFDMDGTLIDTDKVLIETWTEMFDEYLPNTPYNDELFISFSGPSMKETVDKFFKNENYPEGFIAKEYNKRTGKYYDMYATLFENEIENLKRIKKLGFKLAIVTNKIRERAIYCEKLLNIEQFFDYEICGDDVKNTKPDPEGLITCLKHFNVSPDEAIYIGDTEYDYIASNNANIKCIMMTVAPRKYNHPIKPYKFIPSYDALYEELKNYENK